jgi:hypothetical protein
MPDQAMLANAMQVAAFSAVPDPDSWVPSPYLVDSTVSGIQDMTELRFSIGLKALEYPVNYSTTTNNPVPGIISGAMIPIVPQEISREYLQSTVDCCGTEWDDDVAFVAYNLTLAQPSSVVVLRTQIFLSPDIFGDDVSFSFQNHATNGWAAGDFVPYAGVYSDFTPASGYHYSLMVVAREHALAGMTARGAPTAAEYRIRMSAATAFVPLPLLVPTDTSSTQVDWLPDTTIPDCVWPAYSVCLPAAQTRKQEGGLRGPVAQHPPYRQGFDHVRTHLVVIGSPYSSGGVGAYARWIQEYDSGTASYNYGPDAEDTLDTTAHSIDVEYQWTEQTPFDSDTFGAETLTWPADFDIVGHLELYVLGSTGSPDLDWVDYNLSTETDTATAQADALAYLDMLAKDVYPDDVVRLYLSPIYRATSTATAVPNPAPGVSRFYEPTVTNPDGPIVVLPYDSGGYGPSPARWYLDHWSPRRDVPPPWPVAGLDGALIPGAVP